MNNPIYLAVSLDVEEEGLFCGRYSQRDVTVENTASLYKLAPLFALGIRPTLFCAYSVLTDNRSRAILKDLSFYHGAEIAAHLHHWNTPPFSSSDTLSVKTHVPSKALSDSLFEQKLATLLDAANTPVTSFRMGRWDIHKNHFPILAKLGILNDASVRPLHGAVSGSDQPDHFMAPSKAYYIPTPKGMLFEVPLTVTPLVTSIYALGSKRIPKCISPCVNTLKSTTNYWGALALLPCYHPLFAMKRITQLYIARGGNLLSLTWHSSELHPNATPHIKTQRDVDHLLNKIIAYIEWLKNRYQVICLPMQELRNALGSHAPCITSNDGDWTCSHANS